MKTTKVHIDLSVEHVGQISDLSDSMRLDMLPLCFRFIAARARPRQEPSFSRMLPLCFRFIAARTRPRQEPSFSRMLPLCFRFIAARTRPRQEPSFSRSRVSAGNGANCQRQQVTTTARAGTPAENCMVNHTSQYRDKSAILILIS